MKDFRQELYENGYFRQEELCFADCDRYQRARVSGLLNKAAAYAGYDYNARGLTHDVLFEMGEVFLLSRLAMRIHRIPMAGEVLDIATYENGVKGAHMQRVYEMKDQTGEVRVSVKSDWILVNPATRKIMRPSAFTAKPIQTCDRVIDPTRGWRNWGPGRWSGPIWTAMATFTAPTTATLSGTTCPVTYRSGRPGNSTSITTTRPPLAKRCVWWASGTGTAAISWRPSARTPPASLPCACFNSKSLLCVQTFLVGMQNVLAFCGDTRYHVIIISNTIGAFAPQR